MHKLDSRGRGQARVHFTPDGFTRQAGQQRPEPFPAAEHRVRHRLAQTRGQVAAEPRADDLASEFSIHPRHDALNVL